MTNCFACIIIFPELADANQKNKEKTTARLTQISNKAEKQNQPYSLQKQGPPQSGLPTAAISVTITVVKYIIPLFYAFGRINFTVKLAFANFTEFPSDRHCTARFYALHHCSTLYFMRQTCPYTHFAFYAAILLPAKCALCNNLSLCGTLHFG